MLQIFKILFLFTIFLNYYYFHFLYFHLTIKLILVSKIQCIFILSLYFLSVILSNRNYVAHINNLHHLTLTRNPWLHLLTTSLSIVIYSILCTCLTQIPPIFGSRSYVFLTYIPRISTYILHYIM